MALPGDANWRDVEPVQGEQPAGHSTRELRMWTNLRYDDRDEANRLHLCVPADAQDAPLLVFIHGGGWNGGSIVQYQTHTIRATESGYAAATIEYRLVPNAVFPELLYDVARACAWLRANAARYGFDGTRMGLMGSSAGGHLSLVIAAQAEEYPKSGVCGPLPQPVAVVAQCPVTDMNEGAARTVPEIRAAARVNCPLEQCSPQHMEPARFPPVLVQHGDADKVILLDESRDFVRLLHDAGRNAKLDVLPKIAHGFGYNLSQAIAAECLERALGFFGKHVKKK